MDKCTNCNRWLIGPEDVICSWCRYSFVKISASLSRPAYTYEVDLPPYAILKITNDSDAAVRIEDVEASVDWIELNWGRRNAPLELAPRQAVELKYRPQILKLPTDTYQRGSLRIQPSAGEPIQLDVDVAPAPKVRTSVYADREFRRPCAIDVILDARQLERNLLRLEVVSGVALLQDCVVTEGADWARIVPEEDTAFPAPLGASGQERKHLDFRVDVNEERLASQAVGSSGEATLALEFRFRGFTQPETVTVRYWQAPELFVPEEQHVSSLNAVAGHSMTIRWTLQNANPFGAEPDEARAPLTIHKIELRVDGAADGGMLIPVRVPKLPIRIAGGKECVLEYRVDTHPQPAPDSAAFGIGNFRLEFDIDTSYVLASKVVSKLLCVSPLTEYEGILAIDFGTSNSCAAILADNKYHPEPVMISNSTTAPTVIQYRRPAANGIPAQVRVGKEVVRDDVSSTYYRSVVRSPKLKLGRAGPAGEFEISYSEDRSALHWLPARAVVSDYLRAVRAAAETQAGGRFSKVHCTHPDAFDEREITELRAAVLDAFGAKITVNLLSEPLAVALDYIFLGDPAPDLPEECTIGVFDFGGGTTDLALVRHRRNGERIAVTRIGRSGHRFGGEDLTKYIADHAWKLCLKEEPALTRDVQQHEDGAVRLMARRNAERLHQWAEEVKLLMVADFAAPAVDRIRPLELIDPKNRRQLRTFFRPEELVPPAAKFKESVQKSLTDIAADLRQMANDAGIPHPQVILLSGKSSQIPLVGETLRQVFPPPTEVRLASEPKECVVRGACVPHLSLRWPYIIDTGKEGLGYRIGYPVWNRFKEVIGASELIPADGLTKEVPYLWRPGSQFHLLANRNLTGDAFRGNDPRISQLGIYVPAELPEQFARHKELRITLLVRLGADEQISVFARLPDGQEVPFTSRAPTGGG